MGQKCFQYAPMTEQFRTSHEAEMDHLLGSISDAFPLGEQTLNLFHFWKIAKQNVYWGHADARACFGFEGMLGHLKNLVKNRVLAEKNMAWAHRLEMFADGVSDSKPSGKGQDSDSDSASNSGEEGRNDDELKSDDSDREGFDKDDELFKPARFTRPRDSPAVLVPRQQLKRPQMNQQEQTEIADQIAHLGDAAHLWRLQRAVVHGELRIGDECDNVTRREFPRKRIFTTAVCALSEYDRHLRMTFVGVIRDFLLAVPSGQPKPTFPNTADATLSFDGTQGVVLARVVRLRLTVCPHTNLPFMDAADPTTRTQVYMPASKLGRVMAIGPVFNGDAGTNLWTVLEVGRRPRA